MKSFTLPKTDLEKFLKKTVAHLPKEFEVIGVKLIPGSRSVRFEIEQREGTVIPSSCGVSKSLVNCDHATMSSREGRRTRSIPIKL